MKSTLKGRKSKPGTRTKSTPSRRTKSPSSVRTKSATSVRVRVPLGARSYDVQIGASVIPQLGSYLKGRRSKRAFIVADMALTEARAKVLAAFEAAGWDAVEFAVPAGEPLKDFQAIYPLYGELLKAGANRDSLLVALGGGSIGDAAGFIAATYMRGIDWVGLPTTLLAQVDSSVGGKTGINHAVGKNLIGAFHQPALVVCETEFLATLSPREVISGLGEVLKYGLVYDPKFYAFVREHWDAALALDPKALVPMIRTSLNWKAKAVSKDELDRKGIREALNFGHTFAHSIESATRYGAYQHGEAVIWGMRFALALSRVRRKLNDKIWKETDEFLAGIPLPDLPHETSPGALFEKMKKDKKVRDGKIHFVLLNGLGHAISDPRIQESHLFEAYELMRGG